MEKRDVITALKDFFEIEELVCRDVYSRFGEKAWQFFDRDTLHCLLITRRDVLQTPMTINNWAKWNSGEPSYDERGLRCNLCELTFTKTIKQQLYMSAHCNGAGFDFTTKRLSAEECRRIIKENIHLSPCRIRLEKGVSWVHLDTFDDPSSTEKCVEFNP